MKLFYNKLLIALFGVLLIGCGSTKPGGTIISTPVENIDSIPLKFSELSEKEKKNWQHLDLLLDTIPGMSTNRAYSEIIKNRKGQKVVVAVIDAGVDISHEDLDDVIWRNTDEVANNGKDDDNNGYIDDIHGWNFLGDSYKEQMEYTRIVASGDSSNPDYARALAEYNENLEKYSSLKNQYEQLLKEIKDADQAVSRHLGKKDYTQEEVRAIKTQDQSLARSVSIIKYVYSLGFESVAKGLENINKDLVQLNNWIDFRLNKNFKGRTTGDDVNDITDTKYGNNRVSPIDPDETHGTLVAGIIAAERNNNQGMDGVANNVLIMPLRVVPDADEYDKDIALAIRYAVDNGAKIINASFGKYYSPQAQWVHDAIKYAAEKNVLIVHAAGNEALDLDGKMNFPNDIINNQEIADNFLSVGAINPKYGSGLVADYSNFGKLNVDIFAPGTQVYSTEPSNKYDFADGTSFAAPNVSGLAALIWSYYPSLTAAQVKSIIINSGISVNSRVAIGGNSKNVKQFSLLSKSGRIANAYNALLLASRLSAN